MRATTGPLHLEDSAMARPTTVSTELQLHLVVAAATSLPVRAELHYDVRDPYAVTTCFHTGTEGDVVDWTFARSLLHEGAQAPAGEGDVKVWPSRVGGQPVVCLSLSSPSGRALFEVPLAELVDFLTRTFEAVPSGTEGEHVDVDAELAVLLRTQPDF